MKHIHPRRIFRKNYSAILNYMNLQKLQMQARHSNVILDIGRNVQLRSCRIYVKRKSCQNNVIKIGNNANIGRTTFAFYDSNGLILIGDNSKINTLNIGGVTLMVGADVRIVIGNGCMFSNTIDISTKDCHPVYNTQGEVINPDKSIVVGEHCWIGRRVYIGKGSEIANNSIIGAYSVVTKKFDEENVMIAGNPAQIKKRDVFWKNSVNSCV